MWWGMGAGMMVEVVAKCRLGAGATIAGACPLTKWVQSKRTPLVSLAWELDVFLFFTNRSFGEGDDGGGGKVGAMVVVGEGGMVGRQEVPG